MRGGRRLGSVLSMVLSVIGRLQLRRAVRTTETAALLIAVRGVEGRFCRAPPATMPAVDPGSRRRSLRIRQCAASGPAPAHFGEQPVRISLALSSCAEGCAHRLSTSMSASRSNSSPYARWELRRACSGCRLRSSERMVEGSWRFRRRGRGRSPGGRPCWRGCFPPTSAKCAACGGRLRIAAALIDPASIRTYLEGVGMPALAPARALPEPRFEFAV